MLSKKFFLLEKPTTEEGLSDLQTFSGDPHPHPHPASFPGVRVHWNGVVLSKPDTQLDEPGATFPAPLWSVDFMPHVSGSDLLCFVTYRPAVLGLMRFSG